MKRKRCFSLSLGRRMPNVLRTYRRPIRPVVLVFCKDLASREEIALHTNFSGEVKRRTRCSLPFFALPCLADGGVEGQKKPSPSYCPSARRAPPSAEEATPPETCLSSTRQTFPLPFCLPTSLFHLRRMHEVFVERRSRHA